LDFLLEIHDSKDSRTSKEEEVEKEEEEGKTTSI
jgi:hypothetical protein